MWRIIKSSDNNNIGEIVLAAEVGQIVTFYNGIVVPIKEVYLSPDEKSLMVCSADYQMSLVKVIADTDQQESKEY